MNVREIFLVKKEKESKNINVRAHNQRNNQDLIKTEIIVSHSLLLGDKILKKKTLC